jgi:Membrane-associated sensor domain/Stage II sporulation protein E (SpoIIE)
MTRADRLTLIAGCVLVCLLYLARLHSYVLFHTLAEILFIVVCLSVVVMAWSLGPFLDDDFALFLGAALIAVAFLHIVHVVDYPGLGLISKSLDPPTQIWLAARFLLACSLIAAAFIVGRRVSLAVAGTVLAAYVFLAMASVYWWHVFPATLLPGGLTHFKVAAELVICALFVVAGVLLYRRRHALPSGCWRLLRLALVASIVADLFFAMYHHTATWPNMVGHLFLVASALLIFRAIVDDGLTRPHALAMRSLSEAEAMHRRLEEGLMPSLLVDRDGFSVLSESRSGERHLALSGDFIDVLDGGDDGVAIICGDVSGHGANAAAVGAMLRASWQALNAAGTSPVRIVASLRKVLERERRDPLTFATLCLAWLDPVGASIHLLNMGHPPPLLIADGAVAPLAVPPIPPLGTFDAAIVEPQTIMLPDDWQLLFYTDGLIEGRLGADSPERFGEERLIQAVQERMHSCPDGDCLKDLLREVEASGGGPFTDDVTVVLVSTSTVLAEGTLTPA